MAAVLSDVGDICCQCFISHPEKNYANEARTRITFFLSKLVAVAISAIRLTVGETRLCSSPVLSNTDLNVSPLLKKKFTSAHYNYFD